MEEEEEDVLRMDMERPAGKIRGALPNEPGVDGGWRLGR